MAGVFHNGRISFAIYELNVFTVSNEIIDPCYFSRDGIVDKSGNHTRFVAPRMLLNGLILIAEDLAGIRRDHMSEVFFSEVEIKNLSDFPGLNVQSEYLNAFRSPGGADHNHNGITVSHGFYGAVLPDIDGFYHFACFGIQQNESGK